MTDTLTLDQQRALHAHDTVAVLRTQAAINGEDHPATARLRALADEIAAESDPRPTTPDPSFYGAE
jgi:hypothetical protein